MQEDHGHGLARARSSLRWAPCFRVPVAPVDDGALDRCPGLTLDTGRPSTGELAAHLVKEHAPVALDLLDITELAWHDCYGEVSPPQSVIDDMLALRGGTIGGLVRAALLAVTDWRDLKVAAARH